MYHLSHKKHCINLEVTSSMAKVMGGASLRLSINSCLDGKIVFKPHICITYILILGSKDQWIRSQVSPTQIYFWMTTPVWINQLYSDFTYVSLIT